MKPQKSNLKPQKSTAQQFYELLSSMRFAVSMLTILGIASIIGTVLQQNKPYEDYIIKFGQFWFEMFNKLGLFDVYHALWFLLILVFLVISTALCIYRNSPIMVKEWKTFKEQATEKSLRAFSHKATFASSQATTDTQAQLANYLTGQGFKFKTKPQDNGDVLIAAKAGTHQRLGYILTHAAIVIICFGGLLDGNLPFKIQEMLGKKKIETLNLPVSQVPEISRLGAENLSFRANMTLPEGASGNTAFLQVKDGYLVQDLPFSIALKQFRIEHYATGQPKAFESDIIINDPDVGAPIEKTISVNHPLTYKGITIYQSDFQDGGSQLDFTVWDLSQAGSEPFKVDGEVMTKGTLSPDGDPLTVEFREFRKFNIMNLTQDVKGKQSNVGPNTAYKLRDSSGQAKEYVVYMNPLKLDGRHYFVSGMRESVGEEFKYLRIPVDDDFAIDGFMKMRNVMLDNAQHPVIAKQISDASGIEDDERREQFETSIVRLMDVFAQGGYTSISQEIETNVPEGEREKAATAYLKLLNTCAMLAYGLSLDEPATNFTEENIGFVQDALTAMNDINFYGTPYYFQLSDFTQRQASGLQLTKSPGMKWVVFGSILLVAGIFAMFYIRERRIWLLIKDSQEVLFGMSSNRKNLDFDSEFDRIKTQLTQVLS